METGINNKKKDFAGRLNEIANDFLDYITNEFPENSVYFTEEIENNVRNLLNIDKPRIMVYGIYNSGKSTLINALCREEVAKIADRPMTDQISEYDRGDYYLVDSPGVDAPIEHERVTEEFINKCHIILFVISSKGVFEDRDNYVRLARLIESDIPFIIVLNDRGTAIKKEWSEEQKKRARFDHEQDLKIIQYKVIQNLIKETNNQKIADKYEVVVLNAKKALTGILKDKPQLYADSKVDFLDKRICQILQNTESIKILFQQPIANIKACINETEKIITQRISGNSSEDFGMRLHTMESKRDNIMQELRILTQQTVYSHLEELANAYMKGDSDIFETVKNMICMDIDERYAAKLNELFVYVDKNFRSLDLQLDSTSNLFFDVDNIHGGQLSFKESERKEEPDEKIPLPKKSFLGELFKSQAKKDEEQLERLKYEADIKNRQAQYRLQEQIRKRQEARQLASSDLDEFLRALNTIISQGMNEKYDEIVFQIQQADACNKQILEDGQRQMNILKGIRNRLTEVENLLL